MWINFNDRPIFSIGTIVKNWNDFSGTITWTDGIQFELDHVPIKHHKLNIRYVWYEGN